MIEINNPADCCGCSACMSICPHDSITMEPDALGFLYPKVNLETCVNCHLCEKVCAFNDHYDVSFNLEPPLAYGARHKDMKEVETSRSGAAFIALSDYILNQGGVVYGAGFADHFRVVHKRATSKKERDEFKGSKYVQSDMNTVFRQIKQDLKSGLTVLFSGTPCQTSGLYSYIGKRLRENLYLIDIVCHGVPSPYIWKDYLFYLEKKQGSSICAVDFRDKQKFGWYAHHETYKYTNGIENSCASFTRLFYKHIMFRDSCGVCHFTNLKRPSDITIADFWGWEKTDSEANKDNKGLSLILCNSEKGCHLFESAKNDLNSFPASIDAVIQPNLEHPSTIHPLSKLFREEYTKKGFKYVFLKYGDRRWRYRIRHIKPYVKEIIKKVIK